MVHFNNSRRLPVFPLYQPASMFENLMLLCKTLDRYLKCAISHKGRVAVAVASCPPMPSFTGLRRARRTFGLGIDIEKLRWRGELADERRKKSLQRLGERILCDEVVKD